MPTNIGHETKLPWALVSGGPLLHGHLYAVPLVFGTPCSVNTKAHVDLDLSEGDLDHTFVTFWSFASSALYFVIVSRLLTLVLRIDCATFVKTVAPDSSGYLQCDFSIMVETLFKR